MIKISLIVGEDIFVFDPMTQVLFLISIFFATTVTLECVASHSSAKDDSLHHYLAYAADAEDTAKAIDAFIFPRKGNDLEENDDWDLAQGTDLASIITFYKIGQTTQSHSQNSTSFYSIRAPPYTLV